MYRISIKNNIVVQYMTKLLINKIKDDLNAEQSNASKQGIQVKKQFNILDEQLGPNLESMANFFGYGFSNFKIARSYSLE